MKPSQRKLSIILSSTLLFWFTTNAQVCSVNAGIDKTICITQQPLVLSGSVGSAQSTPPLYLWAKLSGPPATIATPASLTTNVTGLTPGNYVFQITSRCIDGLSAKDIVAVTVLPEPPTALAGLDTNVCSNTPVSLSANAVSPPCVGTWTVVPPIGSFYPNANDPNAIYTGPAKVGGRSFTWTVSNGACETSDTKQVFYLAPALPVSAGPDTVFFCKGKCIAMRASYGGYSPQRGLWTVISAPNTPTFSNPADHSAKVCNLVPGIYKFRWSTSGPCAQDSDDVVINVINTNMPPFSLGDQVYTNFCEDPPVSSQVLVAAPLAPGDTATWRQTAGGTVATFFPDNHHATITVGNLTGPFPYKFSYTHTNAAGCTMVTIHTVYRSQPITGLTDPADQQLPCDTTATSFSISYDKLNPASNSVVKRALFVSGPTDSGRIESISSTSTALITTDKWKVENLVLPGTYIYRVEYSNACGTNSQDISIIVSRTPGTVNAGSDIVLPCRGLSVSPIGSANNPGIYSWSQLSGPGTAAITDVNTLSPRLDNLVQGIYTIRLSNWGGNACMVKTDEMNITVTQTPPLAATVAADTVVCAGNYRLSANQLMPTETGTWSASPSSGITFYPDEHSPNSYVTGLQPNNGYTFTWTVSNVCGSLSATQHITTGSFFSPPLPDAGADVCVPYGTSIIQLTGNDPLGANITWTALTPGSTLATPDQQSTQALCTGQAGVYLFEYALGTPECGVFRDTVSVTIKTNLQLNAGEDQIICTRNFPSSVTMNASISSTAGNPTAIWRQLSGPVALIADPQDPHTAVENLQPGNYSFEYKMLPENACEYIADTVNLSVNSEPSDAVAGPDQSICNATPGTTVLLSGNVPTSGTGHWQVLSMPAGATSPIFSNVALPNSTISNLRHGVYRLAWTITNGIACTPKTDDMKISVSADADAGSNIAACSVTTIQLTGNPNTNGTWTLVSGPPTLSVTANSGNTAIVTGLPVPTAPGVYTFRYSLPDIGSCRSSFDDVVLTNYPVPSLANAGGDKLLCFDETSVTLAGNIPVSGKGYWVWQSGPNTPSPGVTNATSSDTILNNLLPGAYMYQYRISTNAACPVSSETIQIIKQSRATLPADYRICNVNSLNLAGNAPSIGQGTWSYLNGTLPAGAVGLSNPHHPACMATGLVPGVYVFRWAFDSIGTCSANNDDIQISIDPPVPAAVAGSNHDFCQGTETAFTIGSGPTPAVSYSWTPTDMLSNSNVAQPLFQGVNNPGNYVYTLKAAIGSCESFDAVNINVRPVPFANIELLGGTCIAAFIASPPGNAVNNPVFNWNFGQGVSPSTASGAGPHQVVFNNTSPANISLEITSAEGCTSNSSIAFVPTCILPVKLMSFDAIWKTDHANISWKVEDAVNLDHFDLERSYNGTSFSSIRQNAYVDQVNNYVYHDSTVNISINNEVFYRLRLTDRDNSFYYSAIKKLKLLTEAGRVNTVWPNPFTDKIKLRNNSKLSQNLLIKLFNAVGEIVVKKAVNNIQPGDYIEIENLGKLAPGFYNLQIIERNKVMSNHKIIKQGH